MRESLSTAERAKHKEDLSMRERAKHERKIELCMRVSMRDSMRAQHEGHA